MSSGSETLSSGERFTEFNFDSKILFNLWVRLWYFALKQDRALKFIVLNLIGINKIQNKSKKL
ncbi:hypothetical protein [Leptospira noguchii]|uniref:hypothetical protein n=1 Tax=Leptospira noguchii TaxID=28182 RepID=UPI002FC37283